MIHELSISGRIFQDRIFRRNAMIPDPAQFLSGVYTVRIMAQTQPICTYTCTTDNSDPSTKIIKDFSDTLHNFGVKIHEQPFKFAMKCKEQLTHLIQGNFVSDLTKFLDEKSMKLMRIESVLLLNVSIPNQPPSYLFIVPILRVVHYMCRCVRVVCLLSAMSVAQVQLGIKTSFQHYCKCVQTGFDTNVWARQYGSSLPPPPLATPCSDNFAKYTHTHPEH